MDSIQIIQTTNIILVDNPKFNFTGSLPEAMLRDIPASSEILQAYHSLSLSGFCPLTDEMRKVLEEVDKPQNGGKKKGIKFGPFETTHPPKKCGKQEPEVEPSTPTKAPNRKRVKKMDRRP